LTLNNDIFILIEGSITVRVSEGIPACARSPIASAKQPAEISETPCPAAATGRIVTASVVCLPLAVDDDIKSVGCFDQKLPGLARFSGGGGE
jgi:hypothetical protein